MRRAFTVRNRSTDPKYLAHDRAADPQEGPAIAPAPVNHYFSFFGMPRHLLMSGMNFEKGRLVMPWNAMLSISQP